MMVLIACPAVLKTAAPAQLFSNSWKKEFGTVDLFGFSSGLALSCWVGRATCAACAPSCGCSSGDGGSFCSFCWCSPPPGNGGCCCGCGCRGACGCFVFFCSCCLRCCCSDDGADGSDDDGGCVCGCGCVGSSVACLFSSVSSGFVLFCSKKNYIV